MAKKAAKKASNGKPAKAKKANWKHAEHLTTKLAAAFEDARLRYSENGGGVMGCTLGEFAKMIEREHKQEEKQYAKDKAVVEELIVQCGKNAPADRVV